MTAYYKDALPVGYELAEYSIEAVLGHGGFGVTYLARDRQLGTQVAIKEYLPHDIARRKGQTDVIAQADDETVVTYRVGLREFLKEGQALARFKHENIVRVLRFLEANGTAYMVMEYEKGESLSQYLRRDGPRLDQMALSRIFVPIMNGLHAVHQAKLLHLDIKPENIYLREDGNPMLIDFGSARQALVGPGQGHAVALTPGYAPIEQYPKGGKQGPWTDVYAIGASLHRCISGKRPVTSTERHQAILRYEPDPLTPAVELGQGLYPQYILESIDWALRIHASERPQSARELQDALMGKNASRRSQVAAPAVFTTNKTVPTGITPRTVPQARRTGARIARRRRRSPGRWFAAALLLGAIGASFVLYGAQIQAMLPSVMNYVRLLTGQQPVPASNRHSSSNAATASIDDDAGSSNASHRAAKKSSGATRPAPDQVNGPPRPGPSAVEPALMLGEAPARTLAGHRDWVHAVAFSPDGQTLASGSYDRTIRLWNVTTGASRRVLRGHGRSINSVAYSPDGRWLASGDDDASVRLWDAGRGKLRHKLRGPDYAIYSVAFSPSSDRLAAAGKDRTVFVWDVERGDLLYTLEGHKNDILAIAFAPGGRILASAGADKGIKLWDLSSGRELATLLGHKDVVLALAFSRDGRWLASGGAKNMLKLWDPYNARLLRNFPDVDHSVLSLSFSPDSKWLAAGGAATGVNLWYTESASIAATLQGHDGYVHGVAFSPDGTTLASASRDHTIKIWTTR